MSWKTYSVRCIFNTTIFIVCLLAITMMKLHPFYFPKLYNNIFSQCFEWDHIDHYRERPYSCIDYTQIRSIVWTHDGTGITKYVRWIVTRKIANVRLTRLNQRCRIIRQDHFTADPTDSAFIQIYQTPLRSNSTQQPSCFDKIKPTTSPNNQSVNLIYFKRKSIKATVFYHWLDSTERNDDLDSQLNDTIKAVHDADKHVSVRHLIHPLPIQWIRVDSENLIRTNLNDCERSLTKLLSLLGIDASNDRVAAIVKYDSHQFTDDALWWDQSTVAERVVSRSVPSPPTNSLLQDDFYHLRGDQSFLQYLFENRRCFAHGTFAQLQSETRANHSSTDEPDRCSWKPFDCAFGDIYSFADREQFYGEDHERPTKCGFAVPSVFDQVRSRYGRNETCQTIVFTCITNCYDPLPRIDDDLPPSVCMVALLDTRTMDAYRKLYSDGSARRWDLVDLGADATPFSFAAKSTETLKIVGQRMFPSSKWIIWLDGKGRLSRLGDLLKEARAPVVGAAHPDASRTSASEVGPTVDRIGVREPVLSKRRNDSIQDILLQEKEYKRDGFYSRSVELKLKMFDIAVFMYRNNHPCTFRFLCGWHNEVNYYSYRGQLSVYYSAVRMNLTKHLHFMGHRFYSTVGHRSVC